MIKSRPIALCLLSLLICAVSLNGCSPSISLFDEQAYRQAVNLKVDALDLMQKARAPYADYQSDVADLQKELNRAYEYANGQPRNDWSARQWALLKDPERNLLGGFLKHWKDESRLSPVLIEEAKKNVAAAFDTIIELESGKIKPSELR